MRKTGFTGRLAGVSARHPWRTITVWVALVAAAFVLAGNLDSVLTQDGELLTDTESETADALIADYFPSDDSLQEYVIVETTQGGVGTPEFDAAVANLAAGIATSENVVSVVVERRTVIVTVFSFGQFLSFRTFRNHNKQQRG